MVEATDKTSTQQVELVPIALNTDNIMKEGDMIIIYLDPTNTSCLRLKKGEKFQNKYGHYQHTDIIGKEYGSKVLAASSY